MSYKVSDTEATREFYSELIGCTYECVDVSNNYYIDKVVGTSYKLNTSVGMVWLNDDEVEMVG